MTVLTYPFGNARYNQLANGTWEFSCQHGPRECSLNIVFACIMARVDSKVGHRAAVQSISLPQYIFNLQKSLLG